MQIALFQPLSPAGDQQAALDALTPALMAAGAATADVLVAPETYFPGYNVTDPGAVALTLAAITELLAPLVRRAGCALVIGYAERVETVDGETVYNSAIALDATGAVLGNYRKIQLYGPRENRFYSPGDSYVQITLGGVPCALLICYDVEFQAHVAALAAMGAQVLLVPTANMLPFTHVSRVLVPANAAATRTTIVYANYCGTEGDLTYAGHSVIAGPHGEILAQAGDHPALLIARIPQPDPARASSQAEDFRKV